MEKDEFNTSFQVQLLFEGKPAGGAASRGFSAMHRLNVAFYDQLSARTFIEASSLRRTYETVLASNTF